MSKIILPSDIDVRRLTGPHWPEAEIIANPSSKPGAPQVLVRRNIPDLVSADRKTNLFYLPGEPVISLFTGAGGMDLGVEGAGFCTVVQHEYDQHACGTLINNRPRCFRHAALIQGDIHQTPTSMLLQEGGVRVGEAGLVCGGPPCQGFSTANSNSAGGTYDKRNDLVLEYLRVVREARPKFFVMENVAGFLTFKGKVNGLTYPEMFCQTAYDSYYELVYGLLDAVDYGVPQHRTRFICMGTRRDLVECDGILASLPEPQNFSKDDLAVLDSPLVTLFGEEESQQAKLIRHAPGVRYFPDRPFLRPPHPNNSADSEHHGRSVSHIEFYRNLIENEPDRIITAPRGRMAA